MKLGKAILVVAVIMAMLVSVASAGNVNPVTVTMQGSSVIGPGVNQNGPVVGDLVGDVDSSQGFMFNTNSPWHVTTKDGELKENGATIDSFFDVFVELDTGTSTGQNSVTHTNREILQRIANVRPTTQIMPVNRWNPANWDITKTYVISITYWLYSDEYGGKTWVTDIITFTWDGTKWHQTHHIIIWSDGVSEIPEFPTIAVPVAVTIGLVFLMSKAKRFQ